MLSFPVMLGNLANKSHSKVGRLKYWYFSAEYKNFPPYKNFPLFLKQQNNLEFYLFDSFHWINYNFKVSSILNN